MQAHYPVEFAREQGCTEAEWLGWLPGAVRRHAWRLSAPGQATIDLPGGPLTIHWQTLPPRQIALIRMPRMQIHYRFAPATAEAEREAFMRYFDLYMQRGGG